MDGVFFALWRFAAAGAEHDMQHLVLRDELQSGVERGRGMSRPNGCHQRHIVILTPVDRERLNRGGLSVKRLRAAGNKRGKDAAFFCLQNLEHIRAGGFRTLFRFRAGCTAEGLIEYDRLHLKHISFVGCS